MSCNQSSVLYQNRYCNQVEVERFMSKSTHENGVGFSRVTEKGLKELYMFKLKKTSDPMKGYRNFLLGASNYAVYDARLSEYLAHKSLIPNSYSKFLKRIPDSRISFCVCTFMKELFVFGGIRDCYTETCFRYNFSQNKWSYIEDMIIDRSNPACSVFEGKITVSGGNTAYREVERYDHRENKWSFLANMQELRSGHSSVSMGNKLFVIGGNYRFNLEVFDIVNRKFSLINFGQQFPNHSYLQGACCIGKKLLIVRVCKKKFEFVVYDYENKDYNSFPKHHKK